MILSRFERFANEVILFITDCTVCCVKRILDSDNSFRIPFIAITRTVPLRQSAPLLDQFCARSFKRFNVVLSHLNSSFLNGPAYRLV